MNLRTLGGLVAGILEADGYEVLGTHVWGPLAVWKVRDRHNSNVLVVVSVDRVVLSDLVGAIRGSGFDAVRCMVISTAGYEPGCETILRHTNMPVTLWSGENILP